MFLNAVTLVLQEILEAALLISVMLAFTYLFQKHPGKTFPLRVIWVVYAMVLGLCSAALYSVFTPRISTWFDCVGQELVNASLHLSILTLILVFAFVVPSRNLVKSMKLQSRLTAVCMAGIVAFAITREGSEIMQYMSVIVSQPENFTPVVVGAIIGAGIGGSIGILLFYGLISLSVTRTFHFSLILLALIAGNMASQVVLLLTQADWLPYTAIVWNSSSLIPESSVVGRLLYALIGYEATPSYLQVLSYLLAIILVVGSPLFRNLWSLSKLTKPSMGISG